jgi:hypothetical protein
MKPESISDVTGGWLRLLVVPLFGAALDDRKPMRLLPFGWLSSPVLPLVGRGAWTAKDADKIRGGNIGEVVLEGHGQILPQKKKCAMQKINLDNRLQCTHCLRMSNTNQIEVGQFSMENIVRIIRTHLTNNTNGNGFYAAVQFAESIWTPQTSFKYVQEIRDGQPWWACY